MQEMIDQLNEEKNQLEMEIDQIRNQKLSETGPIERAVTQLEQQIEERDN